MREQIYNLFVNQSDMTWEQVLMNLCAAALLGFLIFISYAISHRGTIYSKKFNASLVALTVLTGTVMTVIGNNIALSLGMVGALSIVRFRTAIKDSRDTVYIFWTIIAGICCGVGDYMVAAIGSTVTFLVLLLLGCIKSDNRMLLIIRAGRSKQNAIQAQVFKMFKNKADAERDFGKQSRLTATIPNLILGKLFIIHISFSFIVMYVTSTLLLIIRFYYSSNLIHINN